MVIDTSEVLAVLFDQSEREDFVRRIAAAPRRLVSAGTLVETSRPMDNGIALHYGQAHEDDGGHR